MVVCLWTKDEEDAYAVIYNAILTVKITYQMHCGRKLKNEALWLKAIAKYKMSTPPAFLKKIEECEVKLSVACN
jgi:hypothetical protein